VDKGVVLLKIGRGGNLKDASGSAKPCTSLMRSIPVSAKGNVQTETTNECSKQIKLLPETMIFYCINKTQPHITCS